MKYQNITPDVKLGKNVTIRNFVNLYGCEIGDNTEIGTFVEIQKGAKIGKNCKISSHSFICTGVNIQDEVFIGHNVIFINDKYPRSTTRSGELQTNNDWELLLTNVGFRVSIGSGSVILCDVNIGDNSIIGAGSVVTKDVPPNTIVAGNPSKIIRNISKE